MTQTLVPATMTRQDAEALTHRIATHGAELGRLLREAHDLKAWAALGYRSWSAYVAGEFPFSRATSYRLLSGVSDQDVQVGAGELSHGETINAVNAEVRDVDNRPLDSITPDRVLHGKAGRPKAAAGDVATEPPQDSHEAAENGSGRLAPPKLVPAAPAPPEQASDRIPSDRELTARVLTAMHDIDPDDAGPVLTAENATMVKGWAGRTVRAWQRSVGIGTDVVDVSSRTDQPAPTRSPGHVIRPKDRRAKAEAAAPVDPANCRHPKDRERKLSYAILCGVCEVRLR